jgi:hypothetical protein
MFLTSYFEFFMIVVQFFLVAAVTICVIAIPAGILLFSLAGTVNLVKYVFSITTPNALNTKAFIITMVIGFIIFTPLGYMAGKSAYKSFTEQKREIVYEDVQLDRYVLVQYTPPKHVYVALRHERTGALIENQYVAKHCSNVSKDDLNKPFTLKTQVWYYDNEPEKRFVKFLNLSEAFCNQ